MLLAIDDGLSSGNLNTADIFFVIGAILGLVSAILYAVVQPPAARWAPVLLALTAGFIAFGLFLL